MLAMLYGAELNLRMIPGNCDSFMPYLRLILALLLTPAARIGLMLSILTATNRRGR